MFKLACATLSTALLLIAQDAPAAKRRDLSSPSSRLVGTWAGSAPLSECEYYGPVDKNTRIGEFTRFRSSGQDPKTKAPAYRQFLFKYEILGENEAEHRVNFRFIFTDGTDRKVSAYIEPNGLSMVQKSVIVASLGESASKLSYLGERGNGCKF